MAELFSTEEESELRSDLVDPTKTLPRPYQDPTKTLPNFEMP